MTKITVINIWKSQSDGIYIFHLNWLFYLKFIIIPF